jgi:hypothetical protein
MINLRVEGNRIEDLVKFLSNCSESTDDVYKAGVVKEINGKKVGFFVYEVFYLRTQGTVSCSIFLVQTEESLCEIAIVGSGGASAVGITWGAHKDIEKKVAENILKHVKEIGMKGYHSS